MNDKRQISGKIQYSKNKLVEKVRKTAVFSLKTAVLMVAEEGFEPTTFGL